MLVIRVTRIDSGNEAGWEATGDIGAELSEKQNWVLQFHLACENSLGLA